MRKHRGSAFGGDARRERKPEDCGLAIPWLVGGNIMARPQRVPRKGKCANDLQPKWKPDVGGKSRCVAEESPMCHADHHKYAAVEKHVLSHGLLCRAE